MSAERPSPMALALAEAARAGERGEVPVGAVLVDAGGAVLASSGNRTEERADPTAHAEMLVLRDVAAQRGGPRLEDCDLYVTVFGGKSLATMPVATVVCRLALRVMLGVTQVSVQFSLEHSLHGTGEHISQCGLNVFRGLQVILLDELLYEFLRNLRHFDALPICYSR